MIMIQILQRSWFQRLTIWKHENFTIGRFWLVVQKNTKTLESMKIMLSMRKWNTGVLYGHWQIWKENWMTNIGYKRFIFSRKTKGLYFATLVIETGFATHYAAIGCQKRLIYDCMENHVLRFKRKNIDCCVGSFHNGVKHIPHCFEIQRNLPKKRKQSEI